MPFFEAFALAAPEVLGAGAAETAFAFAPEALYGASEFGTAAAFDALGAGALGGLGGLGMAGLEGISGAAPSLGEAVTQGILSGGAGAGEAGINEAMLAQQQAQAAQVANSGIVEGTQLPSLQPTAPPVEPIPAAPPYEPAPINETFNGYPQGIDSARGFDTPGFDSADYVKAQGYNGPVNTASMNTQFPGNNLSPIQSMANPAYPPAFDGPVSEGIKQVGSLGTDTATQQAVREGILNNYANPNIGESVFESPYAQQPVEPGGANRFTNAMQGPGTNSASAPVQSAMNEVAGGQPAPYEWAGKNANQISSVASGPAGEIANGPAGAATDPLSTGFNKALDFAKKNPFSAASMAYTAYSLLNKKTPEQQKAEEYNGPLKNYRMSPNFQGRQANPADFQYTPRTYAEGGIASYDKGGEIAMDYWRSQQHQEANPPSGKSDPGARYAGDVVYDLDPDTKYLDPVTAAQVRMAKINKRANMQTPGMKRPTPMGQLNLAPPGIKAAAAAQSIDPETYAAQGGIMHSNLGGYATGGNPRLLKGPGDGMSDNIPATISGKQPARLADGEFVVPADVVSHLGNGSTDAGAKVLHEMMNKVRQARTGNSKQGKQINAHKFVPA